MCSLRALTSKGVTPIQALPSISSTGSWGGTTRSSAARSTRQWANRRSNQLWPISHGRAGIFHGRCAS
jgi:hypothetical protein